MSYPHIITSQVITIIANGRQLSVNAGNPNYQMVKAAIQAGDWDEAVALLDVKTSVARWAQNGFVITETAVTYNDEPLPPVLQQRVISFWQEGHPFQPLLNFFARLQLNPSRNSVQQLYKFLEHGHMPIDDQGYFYGYKAVRADWRDCHSGKFDNHVGAVLEVPRNQVDDNPANGCSYGFHVGSLEYATGFCPSGGHLLIVKVDPANVVSVPHDCNFQKLRTSKYEVTSEYSGPLPESRWNPGDSIYDDTDEPDFEYDDVEDEYDGWSDEDEEELAELEAELDSDANALADIANAMQETEDRIAELREKRGF